MLEIVSAIPGWAWTLLHLGAIGLLLLWLCWRSGSPHMLLARLWSLAHGKPQPGDRVIRAYLASRSTLMQFRAVTGVRCRTLEDTRRLIIWTTDNNEEIGDVARCGRYFDLRKPGLKEPAPRRWEFITSLLLVAACGTALIVAVSAITTQRAWISIKNGTGKQLLLAPTDIEVWGTARRFTAADCKALGHQAIADRVGIPANEVSTACSWFEDPDLQPFIDHAVRQQRLALSFLIGQLLGYGVAAYGWLTSAIAARAMSRRLRQRESGQPADTQAEPESSQDVSDSLNRAH